MPRRRIENSTRLFGTKALCQGGVQDNDTKRQEGFGNAARFAKRVRIAMLPAIEGAEYIRSRWWEVIAFVVFS